jgi:hypothetical protein
LFTCPCGSEKKKKKNNNNNNNNLKMLSKFHKNPSDPIKAAQSSACSKEEKF